jgi:aspartokinase-like uncharacterized kinase
MDAVVKMGGSLAEDPEALRVLCNKLSLLAKKYTIVIVPGGGKFADVARDFDQRFALSRDISHKMAILGMDQLGLLLSDLTPGSRVFQELVNAKRIMKAGELPIFLPSRLMFEENPLENSWDVTSDSIAAYVTIQLCAAKVILVTDVDGIFTEDPKKNSDAKLMMSVTAKQLLKLNRRTSVDGFLPNLLSKTRIDCYVVNGKHPERVEAILCGRETICTRVVSSQRLS